MPTDFRDVLLAFSVKILVASVLPFFSCYLVFSYFFFKFSYCFTSSALVLLFLTSSEHFEFLPRTFCSF